MPLYMDFHKIDNVTIEDVRNAHMADMAVQDKYGVKYHQFWVNQEAGTVFCLMEGPDMKACEAVHREAHGNIACSMTEVEAGLYSSIMGKTHRIDHGLVKNEDDTIDLGYRNILVASVLGVTRAQGSNDIELLQIPIGARKVISEKITEFSGRETKWAIDDSLIGVFNKTDTAIRCALEMRSDLLNGIPEANEIKFRIGISAGQPVTEDGDFFTGAIGLAHRLSNIVQENQILVSSLVKKLCQDEKLILENRSFIKSIEEADEVFISSLLSITENKMGTDGFTIENLSHDMGLSRPQFYRKIVSLTGRSPHDLIRDIRLERAMNLLKNKTHNISEIALEVGYNNASYFSKCFFEKFGCTPSRFIHSSENV